MKFNTNSVGQKTTNLAGGAAYKQSPEMELVSILLTSFGSDQAYRTGDETFERLRVLINQCDAEFSAKAVVYARTQFGMRSITHVAASELAKRVTGKSWAKDFYSAVIYRPDDMMEILAYHTKINGKLTGAMKKGLARAFDKFDKYALAKYRGEGKAFKLIDVVNLVHPFPVPKNSEALEALIKNELKSFDTWEVELSQAGKNENTEEAKKEVWIKLIKERKLGYFALLKNLRNIIEQSPEIVPSALEMLIDEKLIEKSLVLPFRYLSAYEQILKMDGSLVRDTLVALNKAVDLSLKNVPKFPGETLVVLDVSGSMIESHMGTKSPHIIGSLFSSVLIKSNNCDFMTFSDNADYRTINPGDSTLTIANSMKYASGGTNFHAIFETAKRKYDRIIILSDMQGWIGGGTPVSTFNKYKVRTGAKPLVYSFDLKSNGSMQFPESSVFCLSGFSDKTLAIMEFLESDKDKLIKEISKTSFTGSLQKAAG